MDDLRPDPDQLLREISKPVETGKGKLKIFLGYCPGVGKTFQMLQEAAAWKKTANKVIIGIVETHGRSETEALLAGFEMLPKRKIEYSGILLEELDIDALLKCHPELAIIDEMAHSNAPGSRNAKRYQDISELLNAGIDVFTTLNIQHIESLCDVVKQITGVNVNENVPDSMIEQAAEIELVDLTPEKLRERLNEGKVYFPQQAQQAMLQFFREGNLLALRELSLDFTARQVNADVREYMENFMVAGPLAVGSRLLVGISSSPTSEKLIRLTRRMAVDLNAEWFAVNVASPQQLEMKQSDRFRLQKNLRLVEELGGIPVLLTGTDFADEMLQFARKRNVTLIVTGPSGRNRIERFFRGAILKKLIRNSGDINILIAGIPEFKKKREETYQYRRLGAMPFFLSMGAVAVTVLIGLFLRPVLDPFNIGMILLIPAVGSGVLWGVRIGLFASLLSVGALDFLFIQPYLTFQVTDLRYLPGFLIFVLVALVTGFLARSIRMDADNSTHRERFIYSLYSFTKSMMAAKGLEDVLNIAVQNISEAFECDTVVLIPDATGALEVMASSRKGLSLSQSEIAVGTWSFRNGQPAGRNTETLSSSHWFFLPFQVKEKSSGVIGIKNGNRDYLLLPEQDQLFRSFTSVIALAVVKHEAER